MSRAVVTGVTSEQERWWPVWLRQAVTLTFVGAIAVVVAVMVVGRIPIATFVALGLWTVIASATVIIYLLAQPDSRESALGPFAFVTKVPRNRVIVSGVATVVGWVILMSSMGGLEGNAVEIDGQYYREVHTSVIPISAAEYRAMTSRDQHLWAGAMLAFDAVVFAAWPFIESRISRKAATPEWLREKLDAH